MRILNQNAAALQNTEQSGWQQVYAEAVSDPRILLEYLGLSGHPLLTQDPKQHGFRLRAPWPYIERMRKGDPNDPLLLQILPQAAEGDIVAGFGVDPVGELQTQAAKGVLQKYRGRALLVTTGACAIHCRYCFRRHFPYPDAHAGTENWQPALDAIRHDSSITEVILSGGDPLSLNDERLSALINRIAEIAHVRRLRIHTRVPVVIPQRITNNLLNILASTRLAVVFVVHINHPNEIDATLAAAMLRVRNIGVTLLNQSVLLAGINAKVDILADLSELLFESAILPYYLHLLDPVAGAAHFDIEKSAARTLHQGLRDRLPGYLVPLLVQETPGAASKLAV